MEIPENPSEPGECATHPLPTRHSSSLTFLQLVLHNHQEGNANHEQVEAEADLAELAYGSPAHLAHHILVGVLPADRRGITKNNQTADQENQGNLKKNKNSVTLRKGKQSSW